MMIVRMPDMLPKCHGLVIVWVERKVARNFGRLSVAPRGRRCRADQVRASSDFFSVHTVFLKRRYVLLHMELETRRVMGRGDRQARR